MKKKNYWKKLDSVKHFWKFEVERSRLTKCEQKFRYIRHQLLSMKKCQSFLKIWGPKGHRRRSPHDWILAKIQFWSHNSIQKYQIETFVIQKDLLGQCKAFSKYEGRRSRSPHKRIWTKPEDQKLWYQYDHLWYWILFWESRLNLMHTTKKFSESKSVT